MASASAIDSANECKTVIAAARDVEGKTSEEILQALEQAGQDFGNAARAEFGTCGEW